MKLTKLASALIIALTISGCASSATIGNVNVQSGAKDVSTRDIGKNTQLSYMIDTARPEACEAQAKIITTAGWTATGEPNDKDTYNSITYNSGDATLTLMCSEERDGDKYIGTKITLTLQGQTK